jgi:methionyl-tRNA formyltransferase
MKKLSIAYFGSPDFSARFLEKLLTDQSINRLIEVKLVVTQPDQPVGRKQILTPTPVKATANEYKIPVFEVGNWKIGMEVGQEDRSKKLDKKNPTSNFQLPNSLPNLSSIFQNLDLALVYAFGSIIPKQMLNKPKYGFWNIHPSLLPKYRGTSPMATALINGDKETGVTIIKMDEKIDHGPIIAQQSLTIEKTDKRPDLEKKLTDLAFEMFKKILSDEDTGFSNFSFLEKARIESRLIKQNEQRATYTKKLSKNDGFIEFEELKKALNNVTMKEYNNETIYNLFRGLYPWPGLWTMIKPIQLRQLYEAKRLKITYVNLVNNKLVIKKVQLEGKKEVNFETFKKAYKIF